MGKTPKILENFYDAKDETCTEDGKTEVLLTEGEENNGEIVLDDKNWYQTLENTTDKKEVVNMDVIYCNPLNPEKNFKFINAYITPQGTSSMKYPKKNYRIYTQRDSERSDIPATEVYIGEEYSKFKKDDGSAKSLTGKKSIIFPP